MFLRKSLLIVHTLCVSLGYTEHNGEVSNLLKCYWSVDAVRDTIHSVFPLFSGFQHVYIVKFYICVFDWDLYKAQFKIQAHLKYCFCLAIVFIAIHCSVFISEDLCGICRIPLQTLFRWVTQYLAIGKKGTVGRQKQEELIFIWNWC